jgi:hypothetical protein
VPLAVLDEDESYVALMMARGDWPARTVSGSCMNLAVRAVNAANEKPIVESAFAHRWCAQVHNCANAQVECSMCHVVDKEAGASRKRTRTQLTR